MPAHDLVRTGISGLDSILSHGIPRGNIILLEGGIGTGKSFSDDRTRALPEESIADTVIR